MSRYISKSVVSQEGVGEAIGGIVFLAGVIVTSSLVKALINKLKGNKSLTPKQKEEKKEELHPLFVLMNKVEAKLKNGAKFKDTPFEMDYEFLGSKVLKAGDKTDIVISDHLNKVIASANTLFKAVEKGFHECYELNEQWEGSDDDLDLEDEMREAGERLLETAVKAINKGLTLNGIIVGKDGVPDFHSVEVKGSLSPAKDNAQKLFESCGKITKCWLEFLDLPTSNYIQNETYWIWEVQDMLKMTAIQALQYLDKSFE